MIHNFKEVKTNLVLFMLAGYETTSTTLSYSAFVLAKHQNEQIKLFDEISKLLKDTVSEN